MDERAALHRYKSTSHAAVVGAVLLGVWFLYEDLVRHRLHWDLAAILLLMALTKLGSLLYYRARD